jgi:hypothetical protein
MAIWASMRSAAAVHNRQAQSSCTSSIQATSPALLVCLAELEEFKKQQTP